jgi:hypothetical protein
LLVGTELRDRGFDARYEMEIAGQTPDWSVANEGGNPIEIVDVLTLHQRHDKDLEICTTIRNAPLWVDWITVPADHIYRKLEYKAGQYSALARQTSLPYVLAVFGEFTASISPEEIRHVLLDQHGGWFTARPEVSGVLYFTKKPLEFFEFDYTYYGNPYAGHPSVLLSECPPGRL